MVVIATKRNINPAPAEKPMFAETLQQLGLSQNEAKVYEALLNLKEAPVQSIALKAGVHRRNAYDALAKLQEKGLVAELFVRGEKHVKALDPERLANLIREQETRLGAILPDLKAAYRFEEQEEEAYLHKGIQGFKNYLQLILDTKETAYFIGAKGFWLDPRLSHFLPHFEKEYKRLDIHFMHLFDAEVKEQMPEILKFVGKPYRFLPKAYSSRTSVDIFGPYVVTFIGVSPGRLPENPVQFVMKNRTLADGYRRFFRYMWDASGE